MNQPRDIIWAVSHREDADGIPVIPSIGNATSVSDLYRVVAVHSTGHEGWNSCYVDPHTCAAVARLVEGEIRSMADLEHAEVGLQALFWHDRADVIVPGYKARFPRFSAYQRLSDPRTELAFELYRSVQAFDQIFATEKVRVEDRRVVASNARGTNVVGRTLDELNDTYLESARAQLAAMAAIPFDMSVPAYFTDSRLSASSGSPTFFSSLYSSIQAGWEEATQAVPSTAFAIRMPPLVAVVLDRARDRKDIPNAILELRDATAPVREEMLQLSELVRGAKDQKAVEATYRSLARSFEAIVPASRKEDTPILLPLLKLYRTAKSPLDFLIEALSPEWQPRDPRLIANRTVTGRVFAGLLQTDSMHSLASHFFTRAEVRNLENSVSSSQAAS